MFRLGESFVTRFQKARRAEGPVAHFSASETIRGSREPEEGKRPGEFEWGAAKEKVVACYLVFRERPFLFERRFLRSTSFTR